MPRPRGGATELAPLAQAKRHLKKNRHRPGMPLASLLGDLGCQGRYDQARLSACPPSEPKTELVLADLVLAEIYRLAR